MPLRASVAQGGRTEGAGLVTSNHDAGQWPAPRCLDGNIHPARDEGQARQQRGRAGSAARGALGFYRGASIADSHRD